jgi:hypothetical protein
MVEGISFVKWTLSALVVHYYDDFGELFMVAILLQTILVFLPVWTHQYGGRKLSRMDLKRETG